jgi:hypothetical protein
MKEKATYRLKSLLFFGTLCLPLLLVLQLLFNVISTPPLSGYTPFVAKPVFSIDTWLQGKYQQTTDEYINHHIGFRSVFIRFRNQLYYSLFNETSAQQVVIGKEGFLYEQNYIDAYFGLDFVGSDSLSRQVHRIKKIQDTLDALGVHFAVVLAAGKASYLPEYIPDRFLPKEASPLSNYSFLKKAFLQKDIHHIDLNSWFLSMKDTTSFPLYPKYGIHWSYYGESMVADTLIRYTTSTKHRLLPYYEREGVEWSTIPKFTDNDIGEGMNLLFDLPPFPLGYPTSRLIVPQGATRPNAIVVGDSYYWGLHGSGFSSDVFNDAAFWYYNKEVHFSDNTPSTTIAKINLPKKVSEQDVVFLLCTEASLNRLGFGFIETLYDYYYAPEWYAMQLAKKNERIQYWKEFIQKDPVWMSSVKERAHNQNKTIEETLQADAEFMFGNEEH